MVIKINIPSRLGHTQEMAEPREIKSKLKNFFQNKWIVSLNGKQIESHTQVHDGDSVTVYPPIAGG